MRCPHLHGNLQSGMEKAIFAPPFRGWYQSDMSKAAPHVISVRSDLDIIAARMAARDTARSMGFSAIDQARIATATSELSRNILFYAGEGSVVINSLDTNNRQGIEIIFEDRGPGITDLNQFLQNDALMPETGGLGLTGARRLMDTMDVETTVGVGTRIICQKWLR